MLTGSESRGSGLNFDSLIIGGSYEKGQIKECRILESVSITLLPTCHFII